MTTTLRGIFVLTVAMLLVAPAFGRGAQEVDFLAEFEAALEDEGFSEEEAQAVAEAAYRNREARYQLEQLAAKCAGPAVAGYPEPTALLQSARLSRHALGTTQ